MSDSTTGVWWRDLSGAVRVRAHRRSEAADFVPVNTADDFLHLILGIGMIGSVARSLGIVGDSRRHSLRTPVDVTTSVTPKTAPNNTARWRAGVATPSTIDSLGTGTQGAVALSPIALPAQADGTV